MGSDIAWWEWEALRMEEPI